jgi:transglutaminase superfamily protein
VSSPWTRARVRAALQRRVAALRGGAWAVRAALSAHRQLKTVALDRIELPAVPALPRGAGRGVRRVLALTRATCLERALVRQRWLASHGDARDLVIGVRAGPPMAAHAWLDGDPPASSADYDELSRHPA